jgi:hypothetical protein
LCPWKWRVSILESSVEFETFHVIEMWKKISPREVKGLERCRATPGE